MPNYAPIVYVGPARALFASLEKTAVYNGIDSGKYLVKLAIPKTDINSRDLCLGACASIDQRPELEIEYLRDGDAMQKPEYHAGNWVLTAKTDRKIPVVDANNVPISPGQIRAGNLVRAAVQPFWYNSNFGCGIGWWLHGVQIVGEGEKIGGVQVDFGKWAENGV